MKPITRNSTLAEIKAAHVYAFLDLNRYALDDQCDADRLNPLLRAESVSDMVRASPSLQQYRACSTFVDNLYDTLISLAVTPRTEEEQLSRQIAKQCVTIDRMRAMLRTLATSELNIDHEHNRTPARLALRADVWALIG